MTQNEPWELVNNLDSTEHLAELIKKAGAKMSTPDQRNQTTVASQVYVGLCLRTSIASLVAALGESASAANRHARNLTIATAALVLATLGLVAAALIPVLIA